MRRHVRGGVGRLKFFRFDLDGGGRLRQEVFYLAYHLHWSWSEIMNLDLNERLTYVGMVSDRIETDNRSIEALHEKLRSG